MYIFFERLGGECVKFGVTVGMEPRADGSWVPFVVIEFWHGYYVFFWREGRNESSICHRIFTWKPVWMLGGSGRNACNRNGHRTLCFPVGMFAFGDYISIDLVDEE